eukprot:scaffold11990_cov107-Isochrysis_galbana.AAC.5
MSDACMLLGGAESQCRVYSECGCAVARIVGVLTCNLLQAQADNVMCAARVPGQPLCVLDNVVCYGLRLRRASQVAQGVRVRGGNINIKRT